MQFTPGRYKTMLGYTAAVIRLRQIGSTEWYLKGVVKIGNIDFLHTWNIRGKSLSGETKYDLMRVTA